MSKKVLVVDDDPVGITLLGARLEKEGYTVLAAVNGQKGLERMRQFMPDCIVLDVSMPEMSGYDFIVGMKKEDAFKAIPVIILTSHNEHQKIFASRGITHYLVKPVNFDELLRKVKGLTEGENLKDASCG